MRFVVDSKGNLLKIRKHINKKEKIEIPSNTKCIFPEVFANCDFFKEVEIPAGVTKIDHHAFACCRNLSKVTIPDTVSSIGASAFFNCYALKDVTLPDYIYEIPMHMFYNCGSLDFVYLSEYIKEIKEEAFYGCVNLDNVMLPSTLQNIESSAFERCRNLKSIYIPQKIRTISPKAFKECSSLETVTLPKELLKIEKSAFDSCTSLEDIEIPSSIKEIKEKAFFNTGLYRVALPETIETLSYDAFGECYSIKRFNFGNRVMQNIHSLIGLKNPSYFEDMFISEEVLDKNIFNKINFDSRNSINSIANSLIISTIFNKEEIIKRRELSCLLPLIIGKNIDKNNYDIIKHELFDNYKQFNNLLKRLSEKNDIFKDYPNRLKYYDLYRFARILGAFSDNQIERQKACEFIINAFDKNQLIFFNLHSIFEALNFNEYNKELADFIMDKKNFSLLIDMEKDDIKIISRICNSFEKIKEFGRKNRGAQNYRKVTIDMCQKYFSTGEFEGVDEENEDISMAIYMFTREQETFEQAVSIRKEFNRLKSKKKVSEHILNEELYSKIDDIRKETISIMKGVTTTLAKVSDKKFSYEFLSKYDPRNFVLGKYCSCCAHLEGAGKGIVKASILHPDCQNLVIKNKDGKIIAKSTLYINREQGYGVFNNVEVNESVEECNKKQIYLKYKEAVEAFAKRYNELNPKKPLKQINVGMNLNDLESNIIKNNVKAKSILKGLNFAEFGNYNGDWQDEQYIIWRNRDGNNCSLNYRV